MTSEEELLSSPWHQLTEGLCDNKRFSLVSEDKAGPGARHVLRQGWNTISKGEGRRGRMEVGSDPHTTSNVQWVLSWSLILGTVWLERTVIVSGPQCDLAPSPEGKDTEEAM